MAFFVHKFKGESSFRVNNRFPVTNGLTIAATAPGGFSLMLTAVRLAKGTTSNNIIGVSQNKLAVVGTAGSVYCPFYRASFYIFKAAQGVIADADCQPGDQLDINATQDGLTADSNHDVTVIGNHTEGPDDTKMIQFVFNNVDESESP